MDAALPMFPLGSVLFPHMPLALRVFEERYLVMLSRVLPLEPAEFGVVLIERGQEVGGGEHRFSYGTVAQIAEVDTADGVVVLVAQGDRRIEVTEWLPDDPFPTAQVRELPDLEWDDDLNDLKERADVAVRRALASVAEVGQSQWPADIELSDDPVAFVWQLAGIAPLGPLDQVALLKSTSTRQLLDGLIEFLDGGDAAFGVGWVE